MNEQPSLIQLVVNRQACCRLAAINELRIQAINLHLDKDYIDLLDDWLLEALTIKNQDDMIRHYDEHYFYIIDARDTAFTNLMHRVKYSIKLPETVDVIPT